MAAHFDLLANTLWFKLHRVPDFSRALYASMGLSGVDGALSALDQSLKPLHRLALTLHLRIHWLFCWDPGVAQGQRLTVALGFSGAAKSWPLVEKLLKALPLWPAFAAPPTIAAGENDELANLRRISGTESLLGKLPSESTSWHGVQIRKQDRFREPVQFNVWATRDAWAKEQQLPERFQTVGILESHAECRLISLLRLLSALDQPACFSVSLEAVDLTAQLTRDYQPALTAFRLFGAERFSVGLGRIKNDTPTEDQIAEDIRNEREESIEHLRENPHFRAAIQCWAADPESAQLMADTVLAEALESGACASVALPAASRPAFLLDSSSPLPTPFPSDLPRGLDWLPYVFSIDELSGFCRLPALFDGESIELPKETDPPPAADDGKPVMNLGSRIGTASGSGPLLLPVTLLAKHALVAGVPGSGKTNTLMTLAHKVRQEQKVPYLILEPAKREYRGLLRIDPDVTVFSPGRVLSGVPKGKAPAFRINPFQIPRGVPLAEHLANLQTSFEGAFPLFVPLPALVERAMLSVYRLAGWSLDSVSEGDEERRLWPTMQQFVAMLEEEAGKTGYEGENRATLRGAIDTRFKRLIRGNSLVGDVFDCEISTLSPEDWLDKAVVIELESLGPAYANFLTLILLSLLREVLGVRPSPKLRHLLVLEEAHNLIGPNAMNTSGDNANPKDAATAYVVKLLAEVRALGQGVVIADQLPSVLAPEVLKNTGLKLCHRLLAKDDREMMQQTMMASDAQVEAIGLLSPGQALVFHEALQKPAFAQIGLADSKARHIDSETRPDDNELVQLMKALRQKERNAHAHQE